MTEPTEILEKQTPPSSPQVKEEAVVEKKLWSYEDVKHTLHPDLHDKCDLMWEEIDLVLTDWLGWDYQGDIDLSGCQTWKCVCECLWKHKGLVFCDDDYGILNNLE